RILPRLLRGPRGLALVEAYHRHLYLHGAPAPGRRIVRYRGAPWPARAEAAVLAPVRTESRTALAAQPGTPIDGGLRLQRVPPWRPVEAGWYLLRMSCSGADGQLHPLLLQPDRGHGTAPDHGLVLSAEAQATARPLLLMLDAPAQSLVLRPPWPDVELQVASFDLARVGRLRALWEMLRGCAARSGSLWSQAARFLDDARAGGLAAGADALLRRYNVLHDLGMDPYAAWVHCFDSIGAPELERMRRRADALGDGPTFSVLVPVYNTSEQWLRRCVDSVRAQAYPRWQLCIADDASPDPAVTRVLEEYAALDPRIRVVRRAV